MVKILSSIMLTSTTMLNGNMANTAQEEAEQLALYFQLSVEDLLDMPEHIMKIYWRNPEIDVDELSKALKGVDQSIVDNIAAYLSKRNQRKFTAYTDPLSKRDIDSCQLSFVDLARKMNDAQEINLADVLEATDLVE